MIPILYKSAEVDFTTNGLGLLNDIYSVDIQEQRNGLLTLTASYPTNAKHYKEIETGRIIYAKPNPLDGAQAFRIVKTELDISGYNLNIEADHITYDLTHNLVKEVHLQGDGQNAMTHLQNATVTPHLFRFVSDLQHLGDSRLQYVNPMEAIAGTEGSILQIWGGELHRDNRTVSMLSRRGRDNFTTFRLGKNINGLKYTVDMSNVTTRIVPTVTKSDATDNDKAYFVVGDTVDSKNLNKYPNVYIQHVDMGEKVTINEGETDEQIKAKIDKQAKNWFTQSANTGIDLPQVTVEIDVTSLQDSADYQEKFRNLESVGLTDTVSVYVPEFNVNVTAIVNELHYDPVAERVTSLVVGTSKKSFADNNSNALAELQNSITQIRQDATTAIVSSNGKNTNYYGTEEPAHPVEGDLWFKQVGDETYLMIFKDGRWQEWVSTKTQEEIAKKVDDAIKKANDYTDELNEKQAEEVQKFQSEANAALSSAAAERTVFSSNAASMASSAATHADSMASSASAYAKTEAASALSSANSALTTAKSDLTELINQEISDRNEAVQTVNSQAQDYANQAKADAIAAAETADGVVRKDFKVTTDALSSTISQNKQDSDGRISTAQTTATQALNGLETKVSQTDYDKKTGDLSTKVNTVTQTATETKNELAKVSKTVGSQSAKINTISNTVDGTKQTISDIQTEQGKQSGSIATLQSRADGFDATVTKVNNLAIGGRNLLLNTADNYVLGPSNSTNYLYTSIYTELIPGQSYIFSFEVTLSGEDESVRPRVALNVYERDIKKGITGRTLEADGTRQYFEFTIPSYLDDNATLIIYAGRGGATKGVTATYHHMKLELGTIPTDWTPAPEDLSGATAKAQLTADKATLDLSNYKTDADGRIRKAQSDITATANEVKTKVSQSDFDTKTGDLTTKYGQVKATADAVTTDVAKYKDSNDKKVSANTASISTMSDQISSKVSKTDFDKTTGELNGKFTQQKQTVDSISQTVTELQSKANKQGQVNQLMNTEFNPDVQGWSSADVSDPENTNVDSYFYRSLIWRSSRSIGVSTVGAPENYYALWGQIISVRSNETMSFGWYSKTWQNDNYANLHFVTLDGDKKLINDQYVHWDSTIGGGWEYHKKEGIKLEENAAYLLVSFQARQGFVGNFVKPMLVYGDTVGDYVPGNYNNNARVAELEVGIDHITGLVNDPKKGLSATATLAANGMSVATKAQTDATTAIQTAKGIQTTVKSMGQVNQLMNTEFSPDTEGWKLYADSGSRAPYKSFANYGSNGIGFDTRNAPSETFASLSQTVQLPQTRLSTDVMSLSWRVNTRRMDNYCHIWLVWLDSDGKSVADRTMGNWNDTNLNKYNVLKWENISIPIDAKQVDVRFEVREGTNAFFFQPMLVFEKKVGPYTPGNYNNNDSMQSMRTQLADQITDEIKNRKTGDSSTVTQLTGLIDQKVKSVTSGYQSAITQSANGILASVSVPNQLLNTDFTPDLEGWETGADTGSQAPYRSFVYNGSNVVGFWTTGTTNEAYAWLRQVVDLPRTVTNGLRLSILWNVLTKQLDNYTNVSLIWLDSNGNKITQTAFAWSNSSATNTWTLKKRENIEVPEGSVKVRVGFEAREGTVQYLAKPMLVFDSSVDTYIPGSYSGMNTSTVLELFKDNWALGIADNSGKLISGINGDTSGTVIQGKKLVINSDTTINGKAFINGAVIKDGSISHAQIGNAAISSAQIINVDVSKISGNIANFITGNINTLNSHVLYGDTGHLNTTDTGRVINKQDNHLQLASKGMYNSDNDRAQVELLSHTNDIDANMQGSFNYYSDVRKGHGLGIRLVQNQILAIDEDGGSKMLYLSPYQGGEVRVVSRDKRAYYPMRASSFNAMSERSAKSDIEPFKDCALDIVKNTKVRHYTKNGKSEVGVISDEADPRLLTEDQHAVSLYDYTSVLYKAVQELIEEVEKLKNGKSNSE